MTVRKPAKPDPAKAVDEDTAPIETTVVDPPETADAPKASRKTKEPTRAEEAKAETLAALEFELAGYEANGRDDRAEEVRRAIKAL